MNTYEIRIIGESSFYSVCADYFKIIDNVLMFMIGEEILHTAPADGVIVIKIHK